MLRKRIQEKIIFIEETIPSSSPKGRELVFVESERRSWNAIVETIRYEWKSIKVISDS